MWHTGLFMFNYSIILEELTVKIFVLNYLFVYLLMIFTQFAVCISKLLNFASLQAMFEFWDTFILMFFNFNAKSSNRSSMSARKSAGSGNVTDEVTLSDCFSFIKSLVFSISGSVFFNYISYNPDIFSFSTIAKSISSSSLNASTNFSFVFKDTSGVSASDSISSSPTGIFTVS